MPCPRLAENKTRNLLLNLIRAINQTGRSLSLWLMKEMTKQLLRPPRGVLTATMAQPKKQPRLLETRDKTSHSWKLFKLPLIFRKFLWS